MVRSSIDLLCFYRVTNTKALGFQEAVGISKCQLWMPSLMEVEDKKDTLFNGSDTFLPRTEIRAILLAQRSFKKRTPRVPPNYLLYTNPPLYLPPLFLTNDDIVIFDH